MVIFAKVIKAVPDEWHIQHIQCVLQVSDHPLQNVHLLDRQQTSLAQKHTDWLMKIQLHPYPILPPQELERLLDKMHAQEDLLDMPYEILLLRIVPVWTKEPKENNKK